MNTQPPISDAKTVNSRDIERAAGLKRRSLWYHQHKTHLLSLGERRPGTRGLWWTPRQANLFLRRIGKPQVFGAEEN